MPRLLVIEDHRDLVRTLFDYFEPRGYEMDTAPDGRTGLALALEHTYDAIILDWNLPRMEGIDVLNEYLTRGGSAPVLLLTARDEIPDKIRGFRSGANDYLTKPFALPELEVRIEAMLRHHVPPQDGNVLAVGDLIYDTQTHVAQRNGVELHLYPSSHKLLEALMRASPNAVTREALERTVWGDDPPDADRLRSHMYDLRKVIDAAFDVKLLQTLPRFGYRLALPGTRSEIDDELA